jgi:hypothetical protein
MVNQCLQWDLSTAIWRASNQNAVCCLQAPYLQIQQIIERAHQRDHARSHYSKQTNRISPLSSII